MEPNANFPGNSPFNPGNNSNDSQRLAPNFSNGTSGEPAGVSPFKPTSPAPQGPAPIPENFPPSQSFPASSVPLNPAPIPSPIMPEPVKEVPIPPPPPASTMPVAPKESTPGVVNYGLSGTEEGSRISAGAPMPMGSATNIPSPASFNIPTPPAPQQAPFIKQGDITTPPSGAGDVVVRTLGSDLESLKQSGGLGTQSARSSAGAAPIVPNISKPLPASAMQGSASSDKNQDAVNPLGFEGGPMFTPQSATGENIKKKAVSGKAVEMAIAALAVIGVLAAVYFLVLPKLFPAPAKPAVTTYLPASTSSPITESLPPAFVHHSFFNPAPTSTLTADLPAVTLADISMVLNSAANPTSTAAKAVSEVEMTYNKDPLQTPQMLPVLLSDTSSTLPQYFNNDFTSFVYYDGTDAWPGYVFELNPAYSSSTEAAVESAAAPATSSTSGPSSVTPTQTIGDMVKSVVESANLSGLYLNNPGIEYTRSWANGTLPNKSPVRYVRFSRAGRVFEYGWFGKYLVLSTSYSGIVQAENMINAGSQ